MPCCTDECYEKSCTDAKTRIFLVSVFIVIIALISFSIYLVAKPVVCLDDKNYARSMLWLHRQPRKRQRQCTETSIQVHPQVAAIVEKDTQGHICSGVLISVNWIITAAHCLVFCESKTCNNYHIRAGSTHTNRGGRTYNIIQVEKHPEFKAASLEYDIGLIKVEGFHLDSDMIKTAKVSSVPVQPGQNAALLGWFPYNKVEVLYRDNALRMINLTIQSKFVCKYHMKGGYTKLALTKYMLCGTYRIMGGGCYTDAGSPFLVKGVVSGVAMFGQICYACDYHTSILTDIYYFIDFIKNFTAIEEIDLS